MGVPRAAAAKAMRFLFETDGLPPRWSAEVWANQPWLGWTHIVADAVTFIAYVAIAILLYLALRRSSNLPAPRLLMLFAVFILACGIVHLFEAIIFYAPLYRLSAVSKVVTAIASAMTAVVAAKMLPQLGEYRSPEELKKEVDRQVAEAKRSALLLNEATRELAEEKDRLALALSAGAMGTWDWDLTTGNVHFDEAESQVTGITGEPTQDAAGTVVHVDDFYAAVHPDDVGPLRESTNRAIEGPAPFSHEFRLTAGDDAWRWISGRGKVIRHEGRPVRFVGVNFDITRQKRYEADLAEARAKAEAASNSKSRFLANMSHEVRTPLTAILGCAESLTREAADEETAGAAALINRQGRLLLRVLNDVLDLSKIEAGKLSIKAVACNLDEVLADVCSLMRPQATEKELEFAYVPDSVLPEWIETDPFRLRQILLNLLSNCVKFTTEGSVKLVVRALPEGESPTIEFEVVDTGPGIPADEQKRIFQAFHQAPDQNNADSDLHSGAQGTGLGLTISARLARMLGGKIKVSSEVGVGSSFVLAIPLVEVDTPGDQAMGGDSMETPKWTSKKTYRGRILVAEDTPSIQFMLRKMLKPFTTHLEIVGDGDAACRAAARASGDGAPFDLVLLDMNMPVLSGYDAAPRLRAEGFGGPIIALTASAMVGDRERCLDAGCTAHVPKPISWDTLEYEIQSAFSKSDNVEKSDAGK